MMSKHRESVSMAELLRGGPIAWPKPEHDFDVMKHIEETGSTIIFEDEHIVAFEIDDDEREAPIAADERRITIAPKRRVQTFFDVGLANPHLSEHLLSGLQQIGRAHV